MSTSNFTLTKEDVRSWTESRFVERGIGYYEKGAIQHPRIQENVLTARCRGSRPHPYQLHAVLDEEGVVAARCSCPVGSRGRCKHVVALLLTWIHEPEAFRSVESLEAAIETVPREELEELVKKMVTRHPDLENLVRSAAGAAGSVEEDWVREQVRELCTWDQPSEGWEEIFAREWRALLDLAVGARDRGDWPEAVTVAATMIEELSSLYENRLAFLDRDRSVYGWIAGPAEVLEDALLELDDPELRNRAIEVLYHLVREDIRMGGIEMADPAWRIFSGPIEEAERDRIAEWARADREAALSEAGPGDPDRLEVPLAARVYTELIFLMVGSSLGDEEYLSLCREVGMRKRVVRRLLARGRVDEAVEEVRDLPSRKLESMIRLFEQEDRADAIVPLVEERLEEESHLGLLRWQVDYLREEVASEKQYQVARNRYLAANGTEGLKAFEEPYPERAASIYERLAAELVEEMGREKYRKVASMLGEARARMSAFGEEDRIDAIARRLRSKHHRKRAFQDEMDKAGLKPDVEPDP